MKVVYARADEVPEYLELYFEQGKEYLTTAPNSKSFSVVSRNGNVSRQKWKGGPIHWTRLEYPYRDPEAVEALIAVATCLCIGAFHPDFDPLKDALARLSPAEIESCPSVGEVSGEAALGGE